MQPRPGAIHTCVHNFQPPCITCVYWMASMLFSRLQLHARRALEQQCMVCCAFAKACLGLPAHVHMNFSTKKETRSWNCCGAAIESRLHCDALLLNQATATNSKVDRSLTGFAWACVDITNRKRVQRANTVFYCPVKSAGQRM